MVRPEEDVIGHKGRSGGFDENDEEIQRLFDEKCTAYQKVMMNLNSQSTKLTYRKVCSTLQRNPKQLVDRMGQEKTVLCRAIAFYEVLKEIYGPTYQTQAPLHSVDVSALLTHKKTILNPGTKHYGNLFGDKHSMVDILINNISQQQVKSKLDAPPYLEEVKAAVTHLKTHKAPSISVQV